MRIHPLVASLGAAPTLCATANAHAFMPNGRYVNSTHPGRGGISVVALQSNKVVQMIATGASPNHTVVTRDGSRALVSNSGAGAITEIKLKSWAVTRTPEARPAPEHLVLAADENQNSLALLGTIKLPGGSEHHDGDRAMSAPNAGASS